MMSEVSRAPGKVVFGSGGGFGVVGGGGFGVQDSPVGVGGGQHVEKTPVPSTSPRQSNVNVSPPDCHFFLTSSCSKGDGCQFRHSLAAKASGTVCRYWQIGFCKDDANCSFQHPTGGGKGHPPSLGRPLAGARYSGGSGRGNTGGHALGGGRGGGRTQSYDKLQRNKTPCVYFQQGNCVKGAACQFLHTIEDAVGVNGSLPHVTDGAGGDGARDKEAQKKPTPSMAVPPLKKTDNTVDPAVREKALSEPLTTGREGRKTSTDKPSVRTGGAQRRDESNLPEGNRDRGDAQIRGGDAQIQRHLRHGAEDGPGPAAGAHREEGDLSATEKQRTFAGMPFVPGPQTMIGGDGYTYIMGPIGPVRIDVPRSTITRPGHDSKRDSLAVTEPVEGIPDPGSWYQDGAPCNKPYHGLDTGGLRERHWGAGVEGGWHDSQVTQHKQENRGRVELRSGIHGLAKMSDGRQDFAGGNGRSEVSDGHDNSVRSEGTRGIIALPDGSFMTRKRAAAQQTRELPGGAGSSSAADRERLRIRERDMQEQRIAREARERAKDNGSQRHGFNNPRDPVVERHTGVVRAARGSGGSGTLPRPISGLRGDLRVPTKTPPKEEETQVRGMAPKWKASNLVHEGEGHNKREVGGVGQDSSDGHKKKRQRHQGEGWPLPAQATSNVLNSTRALKTGRQMRQDVKSRQSPTLDFKVSSLGEIKSRKGQIAPPATAVADVHHSNSNNATCSDLTSAELPAKQPAKTAESMAKPQPLLDDDMAEFSEWLS
ncbi:unnamed protein product [Discosporangium mesarthrocarpum]